jgi:hypothetical protein
LAARIGLWTQVAVDNLEEAAARLHESINGAANHLVSMQQAQNGELDTEVAHLQEDLMETAAAINAGPLQTVKSDEGEMLQLLDEFGAKIERYEKVRTPPSPSPSPPHPPLPHAHLPPRTLNSCVQIVRWQLSQTLSFSGSSLWLHYVIYGQSFVVGRSI